MVDVNFFLALIAGFLSFISPCCLPIYPAFLSYITGMSVDKFQTENVMFQKRSILHTLFFIIGFSIIFIAIGFGTSFIGRFFISYQHLIRQFGAILIIFLGLVIVGLLRPKFMMKDFRFKFNSRPSGYIGSIIIGMAFAAGWTPCTGPILVSVIYLATTNPKYAIFYMIAYIIGFAIPFFLMSFFVGRLGWIKNNSITIIKLSGFLMILMGIILYFDWMTKVIIYLSPLFGGFTGF